MSRTGAQSETDTGDHFGEEWVDFEATSNRGGWLVTYADMMTIILTFMILLLSVSQIAQTKFDLLVEALTGRKVGNLQKVQKKVDRVIEKASLGGQVTTSIDEDGMKIQFSNALLFESGKAELTDEALEVFTPISTHLDESLDPEYGITIEGYTDDVPIEDERFDSNWELSTKRAINVMQRLSAEGIDRRRMSVQGFADTRSATDVDLHDESEIESLSKAKLKEVRAQNRRVVIRINRLDEEVLRDILGDRESPGTSSSTSDDANKKRPDESAADRTGATPETPDRDAASEGGIQILNSAPGDSGGTDTR